ncbi:hypothetical protein ANO11243_064670 [Dothideomycetidae sp. 11243]|nr:hypothetical protein ANO11243_064670 [fungal sp. No.11243]
MPDEEGQQGRGKEWNRRKRHRHELQASRRSPEPKPTPASTNEKTHNPHMWSGLRVLTDVGSSLRLILLTLSTLPTLAQIAASPAQFKSRASRLAAAPNTMECKLKHRAVANLHRLICADRAQQSHPRHHVQSSAGLDGRVQHSASIAVFSDAMGSSSPLAEMSVSCQIRTLLLGRWCRWSRVYPPLLCPSLAALCGLR